MTTLTLVQGDLTRQHVDAIVNAANSSLLGGGGVDGAIHRRGGPAILEECRGLRASLPHSRLRSSGGTPVGKGLPTGQAVATTAGDLDAHWVIHTVGPVYRSSGSDPSLLTSCYRESLRVADQLGARTIAFPAISTGAYGWPLEDAARIAVDAVRGADTAVEEVRFVLFDAPAYEAFAAQLG
ncbi:O-acetyl-ADP-ribose deacetylase [Streptomyces sp. GD-15H]|uniref:O-acetyl-ADP-ribose deacetylase n=1 Tax=Streptomyces sp. GD-15H TaxID=3129112 RepID=UPI0032465BFD